eukprot:1748980-Rhodomonas_salina.4
MQNKAYRAGVAVQKASLSCSVQVEEARGQCLMAGAIKEASWCGIKERGARWGEGSRKVVSVGRRDQGKWCVQGGGIKEGGEC